MCRLLRYHFACDCHNHSNCSPDGNDSILEMRRRAQELGLWAHTLTDHCECQKFPTRYRPRVKQAWEEMATQIPREGENLPRFYRGIELGQPNQDEAAAREALAGRDYDFIIGSIHNIRGFEDFFFLDYSQLEPGYIDQLLTTYWEEELEVIRWGEFDSLGHLTYPLRYIEGDHGIPVDLTRHQEAIDQVFRALIQNGKALEVNTSGFRQKIGRALPDLPLLRRYRELGGELVTIGSDAHSTKDLGRGIDEGMDLLKEAGFRYLAVYERRRPILLPLE
jgi:histidinol-phosphatase (PHP family)